MNQTRFLEFQDETLINPNTIISVQFFEEYGNNVVRIVTVDGAKLKLSKEIWNHRKERYL